MTKNKWGGERTCQHVIVNKNITKVNHHRDIHTYIERQAYALDHDTAERSETKCIRAF